ncbi:MAG: nonstructural protein [Microvirus sp.]|nr:MAG: nonstructural protein [Microvirus sp.]
MIIQMFSVYDKKTQLFSQPFPSGNAESAIRAFQDAQSDGNTLLAKHPNDFALYHVGSFDDSEGIFQQLNNAEQIFSTPPEA